MRPVHSHAVSLWYVYVLLEFYILLPVCLWLSGNRLGPLLVVGLLVRFVSASPLLGLDRICEHAFIFLLGGYCASRLHDWTALVDKFFNLTLGTFIIVLGISFFWDVPSFPVGLLSIPALHGRCAVVLAGGRRVCCYSLASTPLSSAS